MELISVDELLEEAKGTSVYFLIKAIVTKLSKIDAEPVVHANWIRGYKSKYYRCSNCGGHVKDKWHNCPHCRAKMDKEIDNE